ncbi:MAG TPA: pirin family protein [Holophagaceae bacterium]|nr:pirin family protein [Holophagaceae bacterium]
MRVLRSSDSRGHFDFGWLDTRHSFSFGDYFDPDHHHYRALRVLNEDVVRPGQGFGTHGHKDMEILTWVLSGALEHKDSLGSHGVIRPGEAQVMSAGTGIRHSEFNHSATEPVHFLQIWLLPEAKDLAPRYGQVDFAPAELANRWRLIASRDGAEGSVVIFQDIRIHAARLSAGTSLPALLPAGRFGYLQVATGKVRLEDGTVLAQGDALKIWEEGGLTVTAEVASEVLWFDLP